jgi:signal transduction histidine kinase
MKMDPECVSAGSSEADVAPEARPGSDDSLAKQRASPGEPEVAVQPAFVDVFQQLINGLPEQIALVDEHWKILAVNEAWSRTAALYGYYALAPGANYFDFLHDKAAEGHSSAAPVVDGILEMEKGVRDSFRFFYHGSDRWEGHTFQLCVNRLEIAGRIFATITRYDVTELVQLRRMREGFSHSLIEGQSEERRRIAREIHDSTLQLLAGLGLSLGQLKRTSQPNQTIEIVADMEKLLGEAQREIRSISYLAHPPLLRELGLAEALQALVEGYGRRTGLRVSLHLDPELKVSWRPAEVAIYRMVQEALSNIHRHAHATDVAVGLYARRSMVHAVVVDNGIGIPANVRHGVGLPSMRARIAELGGRLISRTASPGTMLIASLPACPGIRATGDLSARGRTFQAADQPA